MKPLTALASALIASILLYLAVVSVVTRPLTLGDIPRAMQIKRDYALGLSSPKIAVWAGSNGRYSHRCAAITGASGLPCVNLSLAVGVGIDFQLAQIEPLLAKGDVLYMPLEYSQYRIERAEMEGGAENVVLVHEKRDQLWGLPIRRIAAAWMHFDLSYLVHGVVEMGLARTGYVRRTGLATMTPQGDEHGHTAEVGRPYRDFLRGSRFDTRPLPAGSHALRVLADFMDRMRARGVIVLGGLPTTPDTVAPNAGDVAQLRALYARHGAGLLVLPGRSQFPLDCFFDTLYHLNEECQMDHSRAVGRAIADAIARGAGGVRW